MLIEIIEKKVTKHSNESDTVLDFTMGSGTTAVAARNTGRQFIGIELDKKYYNTAVTRLAAC